MKLKKIQCPYCNEYQIEKPEKNWKYKTNVKVSRYNCKCGRFFNFYQGAKSSWTIPKHKMIIGTKDFI